MAYPLAYEPSAVAGLTGACLVADLADGELDQILFACCRPVVIIDKVACRYQAP